MKDARAVTRQWMSVEHVAPEQLQALSIPRIEILKTTFHGNKLRLGHLVGNRFTIKVRNTRPDRLAELQDALALLAAKGVPNYFGRQRFGGRGDAWAVGRAYLRGDFDEATDLLLGRPGPFDHGNVLKARQHYDAGRFIEAMRCWPGMFRDERRALKTLQSSSGRKKKRAFLAIDKAVRRFYVSAYQSHLFNEVVAQRISTGLDRLLPGDLAWLHRNGAVFAVSDPATEQARADAFEISPTGPLFGYRMTQPEGAAGEIETQVLSQEEVDASQFKSGGHRVKGARRPVRFRPDDARLRLGADATAAYLELTFVLPRGCYATSLLRELFIEQEATDAGRPEFDGTEDHLT